MTEFRPGVIGVAIPGGARLEFPLRRARDVEIRVGRTWLPLSDVPLGALLEAPLSLPLAAGVSELTLSLEGCVRHLQISSDGSRLFVRARRHDVLVEEALLAPLLPV